MSSSRMSKEDKEKIEKLIEAKNDGTGSRWLYERLHEDESENGLKEKSGKISIEACEKIKELDNQGYTYVDIAEWLKESHFDISVCPKTVSYHAKDSCKHTRNFIEPGVCDVMRIMAGLDVPLSFIQEFASFSRNSTVIHHIYNKCSCDNKVPPAKRRYAPSKVREEECKEMRRKYMRGQSINDIASEHFLTEDRVKRHVKKWCNH